MTNAVLERVQDVTPVVLTDRDLELVTVAWSLGREYGHAEIADAIEEARAVPLTLQAAWSWEQQVHSRLDEMDSHAHIARQRLAAHREREIEQDRLRIEDGSRLPPAYESWDDVKSKVDAAVWSRVRSDYWDDECRRWKPGTPEAVRRG